MLFINVTRLKMDIHHYGNMSKINAGGNFYLKTNILYNNTWQLEGEQKRMFKTF